MAGAWLSRKEKPAGKQEDLDDDLCMGELAGRWTDVREAGPKGFQKALPKLDITRLQNALRTEGQRTTIQRLKCGRNSVVECQLPNGTAGLFHAPSHVLSPFVIRRKS
jgi:hypothetical protein